MSAATSTPSVQLQTDGAVHAADGDYLIQKMTAVLHQAPEPVLFARARLSVMPDPAVARPAIAQVNVDLNGRLVRAQAARETVREAIDEVADRLRERMERAARNWQAIRGRRPLPDSHEWRHTSVPAERPNYFPLPADERQVIRHKTFELRRLSVDMAALDMDLLGYQFHLFTDDATGSDSVLYLADDDPRYRLSQVDPQPEKIASDADWVSVSQQPPPLESVAEAVERLEVSGTPFVFFQDAATQRGCVLYHRYDGNYGLITPSG